VAHEFEMARWRSEGRGCTGASNWWLSPWRAHRRSPDVCNTSYYDVVRHQGTWRKIVEWLTPARMIPTSRGPSGYDGHNGERVRANPSAKIFTLLRYPSTLGTNHRGWRESGHTAHRRWGSLNQGYFQYTVPLDSHSVNLTDHFAELSSQILCKYLLIWLWQSCISTNQLQIDYSNYPQSSNRSYSNLTQKSGQCH
jgi:hypothetical protein